MIKTNFFAIVGFMALIACNPKNLPELNEIFKEFPEYDNFQYSVKTTFQQFNDSTTFNESNTNISFCRILVDTSLIYSYFIEISSSEEDLVNTTLVYDGRNYLRLHHNNQTYVLGSNDHQDINAYWGNVFAIKELLSFLLTHDSINYTISQDKTTKNILLEASFGITISLNVPIRIDQSQIVKESQVKVVLDKDTYFPVSYSKNTVYVDGKRRLFKHEYTKPIITNPKIIVAVDSIPSNYQQNISGQSVNMKNLIDKQFPDYRLQSLSNEFISNRDLKGKTILYDFFSLYCAPCKLATDDLIALKHDINSESFEIICIDVLREPRTDQLILYKNTKNINYPILLRGSDLEKELAIISIPTFVLVNKDNKIIMNETGYSKEIIGKLKAKIESEIYN